MNVERATCDQRVLVGCIFITQYFNFIVAFGSGACSDRGEAGGSFTKSGILQICCVYHTMYEIHVTAGRFMTALHSDRNGRVVPKALDMRICQGLRE